MNAIVEFDKTFPFILSHDDLQEYRNGFVNWHKQPTIEISFVIKGAVEVFVLSQKATVKAGGGFFIMPGNLHSVVPSAEAGEAVCFTFIFAPEVLYGKKGGFFEIEYYAPFLQTGIPFFTFSENWDWTQKAFEIATPIERAYPDPSAEFKLKTQRAIQDIWILFYNHILIPGNHDKVHKNTKKILEMISYINNHYAEKFSLSDMAAQVAVSKSECSRYFKKAMNITISEYLLEYRLAQAVGLLETSTMNITEIAHATGFCDASYFIRKFQEKLRCSPEKYRKQLYKNQIETTGIGL
ncbi:AraC family transcriptional regulator [Gemmiger sp.]